MCAAIDWTKWSAIGSLAAALATALVAAVTLGLVIVTKAMVSATKRGLEDDWGREWAAQRPLVYPLASAEWARGEVPRKTALPLKNGGRGPALNVKGTITSMVEGEVYERALVAGTIAAGDLFEARIEEPGVHDWTTVSGVIQYADLAGGHYAGRFECALGPGSELVVTVHDPTHTTPAEILKQVT